MINNAITHCLKDIKLEIPSEILFETFMRAHNAKYKSLDSIIKEKVIVDIVLRKVNLYAGKLKKIELIEDYITYLKSPDIIGMGLNYAFYSIPAEVRENRDIISVIGLTYPITNFANEYYATYQYDSIQNKTAELYENTFGTGQSLPIPYLLDNNVIKLDPPQYINIPWLVTCLLSYDSNFTNISINMIESLSKLSIYATQIVIYNTLKIPINVAYLHSGAEIGAFKDIVESYSDANDKFKEELLNFRGAATFDKENIISMLNLMNI